MEYDTDQEVSMNICDKIVKSINHDRWLKKQANDCCLSLLLLLLLDPPPPAAVVQQIPSLASSGDSSANPLSPLSYHSLLSVWRNSR